MSAGASRYVAGIGIIASLRPAGSGVERASFRRSQLTMAAIAVCLTPLDPTTTFPFASPPKPAYKELEFLHWHYRRSRVNKLRICREAL